MAEEGEDPDELVRRAFEAFDALRPQDGFTLLLRAASVASEDREWVATVAEHMRRRGDPTRVWQVWQIRCTRQDASPGDFLELARAHMFNAGFHGTDPLPIDPMRCGEFERVREEYRLAVEAMRQAIERSRTVEETALLLEELATYHAIFGRYRECLSALEGVAELRPPSNRWRFAWEPGDDPVG